MQDNRLLGIAQNIGAAFASVTEILRESDNEAMWAHGVRDKLSDAYASVHDVMGAEMGACQSRQFPGRPCALTVGHYGDHRSLYGSTWRNPDHIPAEKVQA